jgi:hypothetical protein
VINENRDRRKISRATPGAWQADRILSERGSSMARLRRTSLPDQPIDVIPRGNDRGAIFFREDDDTQ